MQRSCLGRHEVQNIKNTSNKIMKKIFLVIFLFSISYGLFAQELNCNVQINSSKIQGSNKSVFNTLQKSMNEFLNNRRWTDLSFEKNERIECSINIIVNAVDGNNYTTEMIIQARRPVYNSSYNSTLLNFKDNTFNFTYKEFDPLEFAENDVNSSLTATLAYYAYLIIGFDMDSFSRLGGTPYFQQAENIVNQAQSKDWAGWKAFENSKNRYALINNIMDEAFKKFREYFYEYHRLGLDMMTDNTTNGRAKIAEGIQVLRDANRARPSAILISSFLDAKNDELINIFKQGTTEEKDKAIEILTDVNPAAANRYEEINKK
ncbi:conserved hypothetical protein [uncultured Paludibacter sp.]|uniref:DUF4835 domain-containing protein n=1 Tax=uncultured Paludibacter sp. TaxID=497635 RepID=A0A653AA94_9BACT|nr:conserved hypothetical protein [uncultured Paludibacter sp.]